MSDRRRLLWVVPEQSGGVRSYSDALWPAVRSLAENQGYEALDPWIGLPEPGELGWLRPDLIHIQHEFGLFGSKLPGFYRFPGWLREMKRALPRVRFAATAHTVLDRNYIYPWKNRGWQTPIRILANQFVVPLVRETWIRGTWGDLHGVIVHSKLQKEVIRGAGCAKADVIPHFVPHPGTVTPKQSEKPSEKTSEKEDNEKAALVFGYFSPEKGQDLAIEAWDRLRDLPLRLILAGGVRRREDRSFFNHCLKRLQILGLQSQSEVRGYVKDDDLDALYKAADLVIAPFRETSGSGSLALALSRGAAILASDLPLNLEIDERERGALVFFRNGDPEDLAVKTRQLILDPLRRKDMAQAARKYAGRYSPEKVAEMHFDFYQSIPEWAG